MKLYSGPLSLFARKVEIALHEKGLAFERVMVPFNQAQGYSPKHPDVLALNPKGQVPVLLDRGLALYDSTVILEYLEDAYPNPPLYPRSPEDRARCRLLDLFADEVMLVPLRALMHRTAPRALDPERWDADEAKASAVLAVIAGHLGQLDRQLRDTPHLCGAFGAADIAVFMAVLFSQRLGGPPLDEYRFLAAWYAGVGGRPAVAPVVAEIIAADLELSVPVDGAYGRRVV